MLSAVLCCQIFGGTFGYDHVQIDEEELFLAIRADLKDDGRAKIRSLGGYSPAAFPTYLKYLDEHPVLQNRLTLTRILLVVQQADGDRSTFRMHAVGLVTHEDKNVSRNAILLLAQIGTADDSATVANQLKRQINDVAYFDSIITTLSAIGTEKEIEAIKVERQAGLLKDHSNFWARVDECEKVIRERAAKKKEGDLKAPPPEKK